MADVLEALKKYHHAQAAFSDAYNAAIVEVAEATGPATDEYIKAKASQAIAEERERLRVAGLQLDLAREEREQQLHNATLQVRDVEMRVVTARERGLVPAEQIALVLLQALDAKEEQQ